MPQKIQSDGLQKIKVVQTGDFACMSTLVVVMFFLTGIWFIYLGISELHLSRASYRWPSVTGQVVGGEIAYTSDTDAPPTYTPIITYEYVASDRRYTSQQVSISSGSYHAESDAVQVINTYPINSQVTVYYDPDQPDFAVLELKTSGYGVLIAGFIFAGLSLGGVLYVFWLRRRSAK